MLIMAVMASGQANQSVYTDLGQKACKMIMVDPGPGESSTQQCPGVAGYKLLIHEGDLRQSITVVKPDGSKHDLDLWSKVGAGGFSYVGPRAEWRVKRQKGKITPLALIVRYEVSEGGSDNPDKKTSYLSVSKITPEKICLTDSVRPSPNMNVEARRLADNSASKPCIE
jgi:hypothetical protein